MSSFRGTLVIEQSGGPTAVFNSVARLWGRFFGFVYTSPQPKSGNTMTLKNKDGLSMPAAFTKIRERWLD